MNSDKNIVKKIVSIFVWVFLVFAIFTTVVTFAANASGKGYPVFGDKIYLSVKSDSMKPEFKKGDLIVAKVLTNAEKSELKKDDIITFYADLDLDDGIDTKDLNTHRIIEVQKNGDVVYYKTKGDNNPISDPYIVPCTDVEAVYIVGKKVPVLGSISNFFQSSTGFLVCIVIPLFAFAIYELIVVVSTITAMKTKKETAGAKLTEKEIEEIKRRSIEEYLAEQKKAKKDTDK